MTCSLEEEGGTEKIRERERLLAKNIKMDLGLCELINLNKLTGRCF